MWSYGLDLLTLNGHRDIVPYVQYFHQVGYDPNPSDIGLVDSVTSYSGSVD